MASTKKTKVGIPRIFLLALLILGITVTQGMISRANAVTHFSRACLFGTNESGTWNWGSKIEGWFWVNSKHYNFNTGTWHLLHLDFETA